MAFTIKNIKFKGISIDNAHLRIDTFDGKKESVKITCHIYTSKESFEEGTGYLQELDFKVPKEADTPVTHAWLYDSIKEVQPYGWNLASDEK